MTSRIEHLGAGDVLAERACRSTVRCVEREQVADGREQRAQSAGVVEVLHQVLARRPHVGDEWRRAATSASKRSRLSAMPRAPRDRDQMHDGVGGASEREHRRRSRCRCSLRVTMSVGFKSSQTISTMRRPVSLAIRAWRESAAGIDAAPGSVKPSASVARRHRRRGAHRHAVAGRARDAVLHLLPRLLA